MSTLDNFRKQVQRSLEDILVSGTTKSIRFISDSGNSSFSVTFNLTINNKAQRFTVNVIDGDFNNFSNVKLEKDGSDFIIYIKKEESNDGNKTT